MVLFLFIIMMLELAPTTEYEGPGWQRWVPVLLLAAVLFGCTLIIIFTDPAGNVGSYSASPREFGLVLFRDYGLRHRHAVAGDDDDAVGVVERAGDAVGVDGDHLALDLHRRARGAAEAAQDHRDEAAVHRLAHDVAEDRTGRTDQRADHDQKIVSYNFV